MPFKPDQSGNPRGGPPKSRAMTTLLEKLGDHPVLVDDTGQVIDGKTFVAARMWELLTTGHVTLGEQVPTLKDGWEWFEVAKWLYSHVDGPPRPMPDTATRDYLAELAAILRSVYAPQKRQGPGKSPARPPIEFGDLSA